MTVAALSVSAVVVGDRMAARYLGIVAGQLRPSTPRAVVFDLTALFTVTGKDPVEVSCGRMFDFLAHQRGDRTVVAADGPGVRAVGADDRQAPVIGVRLICVPGRPW